jgi:TonB-dependent starch-binding outer membrane protein SusC
MKLQLRTWFFLLAILLMQVGLSAQNRTVIGKVIDATTGEELIGVTIVSKGTTKGTATDIDGDFSWSTKIGETLVIRSLGYESQEVIVGNQPIYNIRLVPSNAELAEIVVNAGYGTSFKKREVTGAISQVKGADFEDMPVQTLDRAMQGRSAGVSVQANNGVPGGSVTVRIRGVGSIKSGTEPLYIVDGIAVNNSNNSTTANTNPLGFLNPNDIESIEILKDAAAAAIYGQQAGNGVVLVTTKKAKDGNTKVNFSYSKGYTEPTKYLNVLNTQDWIKARTEAVFNQNPAAGIEAARKSVLSSVRLNPELTAADIAALPTYDWQKAAYKSGDYDSYTLSLSGGSEKTKFYLSAGFDRADANVLNVNFQRVSTRLNVTHQLSKNWNFDQTINLSNLAYGGPFGSPNGGSFLGSPSFAAPLMLPMNPIYNADGTYYGTPQSGGTAGVLNQNVLLVSNYNTITSGVKQAIGAMSLTGKILDNLIFRTAGSLDYRTVKDTYFADPRTADGANINGRLTESFADNTNGLLNATLNYLPTLGLNHFNLLSGIEYRQEILQTLSAEGRGFPTPQFRTLSSAATPFAVNGSWTGYKLASTFGRIKYDFDNRFIVEANARYGGSSRFGANNRYGLFKGISAGWNIAEEGFIKNGKNFGWIDQLKIRANWGETGNDQIGNFDSRGLYSGGAAYDGVGGINITSLANANLRWERVQQQGIGIDYSFFRDRVSGSVDYFVKTSKDLLLDLSVPQTSGFNSIASNVGEIQNKGIEVEIRTVNVRSGSFEWRSSFTYSDIQNKVTKLYDGIVKTATPDSLTILPGFTPNLVGGSVILGYPIGAIFTSRYAGVNPATGRPMWYDAAGNITYNPKNPGDFKVIGAGIPRYEAGCSNTIKFMGVEIDALFTSQFGRLAANNQGSFLSEDAGRLFNSLQRVYDRRWQKPGDITDVPRPFNGNAEARSVNQMSGTRIIEDASFIRLKTLSVAYSLPKSMIARAKCANFRISAQAVNLLTWTKWTGYDPEFLSLGSGNNGVVPQSRSVILAVQVGF